jgi:predicted nucleotidyltransferase
MNPPAAMLIDEVRAAIAPWAIRHQLRLVVVFGSLARNSAGPRSDVDLAIWPSGEPAADQLLDWNAELARLSKRPVQLVAVSSRLDPVLGFEIARDGKVIHEALPGIWTAERLKLWHAYQDAQPFLRLARERLRKFVEEAQRGA